jgi:alkaline phosphatase
MRKHSILHRAALIILVLAICLVIWPTIWGVAAAEPLPAGLAGDARNVILLIGDGMGPSTIGLAKDYARIVEGRELWIEKAISGGNMALVQAPALGTLVTDSAAAATAIATGARVSNGVVSLGPDGERLTTILELAEKKSRATGLVTTTSLTHATPAAFAAHVSKRSAENEIAVQMLASGVEVLLGGGLRHWMPKGKTASDIAGFSSKSKRKDNIDLVGNAREKGYHVVTSGLELEAVQETEKLFGIFSNSHMPYALDRRPDDAATAPSLVEMTTAALGVLAKNENGFFLMVEGGRIDHASHANDVAAMLAEMMEFDEAVGVAMTFADEHPGTTVFITADHVTGGPCLSTRYSDEAKKTIYPKESDLRKIAEQDASFKHILTRLSKDPTPGRLKKLVAEHAAVNLSDRDAALILKGEPISPFHVLKPRYRKFGYPSLSLGRVLGLGYGITWASSKHFSEPVLLVGYGASSSLVHGYIENTEIFGIMKAAGAL